MKTKIVLFFVLVFGFCAFADDVSFCLEQKQKALEYISSAQTANDVTGSIATQIIGNSTDGFIQGLAYSIYDSKVQVEDNLYQLRSAVSSISCNASNDTCSVDLGPLVLICSNIYDVVSAEKVILQDIGIDTALIAAYMANFNSTVHVDVNSQSYVNVFDSRLLSAVSNFNNDVSSSFDTLTNQFAYLNSTLSNFYGDWSMVIWDLYQYISEIYSIMSSMSNDVQSIAIQCLNYLEYLRYLEVISRDISYLATNEYFNVNVNNLTNFFAINSARVQAFTLPYNSLSRYGVVTVQNQTQPYTSATNIRQANIAESLQGGFINLIGSVSSLNNYFYWLMNYLGTNKTDYSEITTGLANLTNILNRVDDYVLGDFSNQFYNVFENIDTLVSNSLNQVDYTTNLVEIASLLQSSSNHLASIDSKLDVLDYIKVLSNTPLSDFSGDSYYDYLTNLYLNGASSSAPSTNWFERIEILLASMVFGDSSSSSISNEVEFTNFSEETIENAFNDYTFQNELNSGIDLVENTGENFLTILRGFHDSLSSVTQPQSIAIGIGGLDGQDTTTYEDVMHGHFQVSFNSGASDNFTLIVRSVTTIIWILVTMMLVYFSARWLLSKVLFFYRLMRTLITSLFLK